ncbi:carboxymuconolactone decarboxylase family protein [Mycolicibacterium sp. CH28]|uniref:carboxymuconolactone decarboxylase family protein n=1 Tax=Mycolicibacterium sp. CH28 TaxID=2512237 RepID=UPI00138745E0|nr:carboxymuconolactone decarboxylase family protein [Mycolicibacterium sp. CH28]
MSRITAVEASEANPQQLEALQAIEHAWGQVPNLGRVIALSLPLTHAVLRFDDALNEGALRGRTAELLAVAVSEQNRCRYCLSAHSAAARAVGASASDIAGARVANVADMKTSAALQFAQAVVRDQGHISDDTLTSVRQAGWTDSEILEIVGHTIATTLTNYVHHLSRVVIDYPPVQFASEPNPGAGQ